MSDGTPVLRVELTPFQLSSLGEDSVIYRVEETNFFRIEQSVIQHHSLPDLVMDSEVEIDSLSPVVVIDSGIDFSQIPILQPLVLEHWVPEGNRISDPAHGTQVASRVILGENIGQQITMGSLTPHARVIDACVFVAQTPLSEDQLILWIKEIVETYHEKARIYNLSVNASRPIQSDRISLLAYEIDNLSCNYGVVFVISAGNHHLWKIHDSIDKCLDDDDVHIASPAESYLSVTVGAINDKDDPHRLCA
ncbi:MAG: S8 family serine peptidase [Planctomycetaceae bacterium]|nr:S8 family serine peptidase [Planctomycetaceae bacterium]